MPLDPLRRIETLRLSPSERVLANLYARRMGRFQPNEEIRDRFFHGTVGDQQGNAVSVYISTLKKKLPEAGLCIEAPANSGVRRMLWQL